MPLKPNFKFQRAERDRAKKALKEAKLQERKEQAVLRKTSEKAEAQSNDQPAQEAGE